MKRSFIREILENTTNETISFAGGLPDAKLFPQEELKKSAARVMNDAVSLQYFTSTGLDKLKEKISQIYNNDGFETSKENIMITSGSQQALDIISRYNNNKSITIEAPSYLGAMNVFALNNMSQDSITLKEGGCDTFMFNTSFKKSKLAYLIPDFQNPTGYTYSEEKRKEVANIVKQYDGILIEDAPYSEIYFEKKYDSISKNIPNNSYHLGSFSKTLSPALRVGWIRASKELLEPLVAYKEAMDLHTNGLAQSILSDYLKNNTNFISHKNLIRKVYKKNMQIFAGFLDEILPEFKYTKPKGGMFIYGKFEDINSSELVNKCMEKGVVFVPGAEFYNNENVNSEIRFNFTHCSSNDIYKGLNIIKQLISKNDIKSA
ncbi:MAG TPA: PLP-dependent aminotransferase family protein [Arcobacter sp.]|nr:PLP-dependent aminotransferase family protein [Arcobacter sp.]HIP55644.1 PLP-dependent aminotransferase family protein [Arcobacter sp.]